VTAMTGESVSRKLRATVGRFIDAREGNIAVIFAVAAIPILSFVGAAVDYTRATAARSSMQAAMDSTALMLSKDLSAGTINTSQIATKATEYFNALYKNNDAKEVSVSAIYTPPSGSTPAKIEINGTGHIATDFMRVAGFPNMNFGSTTTTTWGNVRMRVALVLDVTGSMSSAGKMDALKPAAKALVDQLSAIAVTPGDIYISIVPFSKDVNAGPSNYNASWIDWTNWLAEPPYLVNNKSSSFNSAVAGSNCPFTNNNSGFTCMDRPATLSGAQSASKIPSTGTYAGYICPSMDNGNKLSGQANIYYNGCYTTVTGSSASCGSNTSCNCTGSGSSKICHLWRGDGTAATAAAAPGLSTWNGCTTDRTQDYDTKNTAPTSTTTQFPAEQYSWCSGNTTIATITPLSYDWTALKAKIDTLVPTGNTNQGIGLAWGWMTLSQTDPYNAPAKDPNFIYKDAIVILSDGLNTQNRWYSSASQIDARQKILCDNAKAANITIYTVQVNTGGDPTSAVLQYCAQNTSSFYLITNASQTATVFNQIGTQLSKLRVSK
jgi:Flp pilus assembly protein TadG